MATHTLTVAEKMFPSRISVPLPSLAYPATVPAMGFCTGMQLLQRALVSHGELRCNARWGDDSITHISLIFQLF
jgi:hypothetical protein